MHPKRAVPPIRRMHGAPAELSLVCCEMSPLEPGGGLP